MVSSSASRIRSWSANEKSIALAVAALSILPFVLARYPQLVDYPSHLARFSVMLRHGTGWIGDRYYDFHWALRGNLGTDLLAYPLGTVLGVERAGLLIVGAIPPLTILAIFSVSRALGRPASFGAFLALPFVYSQTYLLGFMNYTLAVALALFGFAGWIGGRWPRWLFAPFAFLLWLCHVSGWGVFCLLAGGYELSRTRDPVTLAKRLWPAALPAILLPMVMRVPETTHEPFSVTNKIRAWVDVLADHSLIFDVVSLTAIVFLIYWALRSGRAKFDLKAGIPAILLSLGALLLPPHLGGGDFADARLVAPAMMMFCLALDWHAGAAWKLAAFAIFAIRLAATSASWFQASQDFARDLKALDLMPAGARVLNVVATEKQPWEISPYLHLSGYGVVRKGILVNSNFAIPGVHLMSVRDMPRFADPSQIEFVPDGSPLKVRGALLGCCDYLWLMSPTPRGLVLPAGTSVIYRTPNTVLANVDRKPASTLSGDGSKSSDADLKPWLQAPVR